MPTNREVDMADAYGGQAKGMFRQKGVRYNETRLINRIKTPANIAGGKAALEALAATIAGQKNVRSRAEEEKRAVSNPRVVRKP